MKNKLSFFLLLLACVGPGAARADFHVWTGAVSGYWSNTNNWQGGEAPNFFETPPVYIEFPTGPTRTAVTNDIYYGFFGALSIDSLIIGGSSYHIYGKGGGTNIVLTGNPAPFYGINLQNIYCAGGYATLDGGLSIYLEGTNTITNASSATLEIQSSLIGPGAWAFEGLGELYLDGTNANYFEAPCSVLSGTAILANYDSYLDYTPSSISSPLIIGTTNTSVPATVVEYETTGQFGGFTYTNDPYGDYYIPGVTVEPSGTFQIYGMSLQYGTYGWETIGSLTMTGGVVALSPIFQLGYNSQGLGTNNGELEILGPITVNTSQTTSRITGHGLGWHGYNPGQEDSYDYQSASLILLATNVLDVESNAFLVIDTPFTTDNWYGGGFGPVYWSPNYLVKTGAGTIWDVGTNLYAGSTIIQQGAWIAGGDTPFGSTYNETSAFTTPYAYWAGPAANQVVVSNGAQILVFSGFSNAVPLVLNGFGVNQTGALETLVNGAHFTGGCTLASESSVSVAEGTTLTFDDFDNTNGDVPALGGGFDFHMQGGGTLELTMSLPAKYAAGSVLSGACRVEQGSLILNGQPSNAVIKGPLIIGTNGSMAVTSVTLGANEQFASNVPLTINDNGELVLDGYYESVGPLALNGGAVGFGTLNLRGNVTAQTTLSAPEMAFISIGLGGVSRTFTIPSNTTLNVLGGMTDGGSSAGFTKAGPGELSLAGTGTYTGTTFVNAGVLSLGSGDALGSTSAGTVVAAGAEIDLIGGISVGAEPLSLSGSGLDGIGVIESFGTNSWAGPITLASDITVGVLPNASYPSSQLELSGVISGSGGLTKTGAGNLLLDGSAPNTYTGATLVLQGPVTLNKTTGPAIPRALTIGTGIHGPGGDSVRTLNFDQLPETNSINISASGLLDISAGADDMAGSLTGSGQLQLGSSELGLGYDNTSTLFSGSISGTSSGNLLKTGTGTFTYTGSGAFAGTMQVNGPAFVNGSLASAQVTVYIGGTLGGTGSVGPITSSAGFLSPGVKGPGLLNSSNLSLGAVDTFVTYINSTNSYSELNVVGTISLGNANLHVIMPGLGASNAQYTIINNPSNHPVTGTFSGLAEGSTISLPSGAKLKITYHGGTGNSVVLTQTSTPTPPDIAKVISLGPNTIEFTGTGVSNLTYHVQNTTNLLSTNWITLGPTTADGLGNFSFTAFQATNHPVCFYRLVYP